MFKVVHAASEDVLHKLKFRTHDENDKENKTGNGGSYFIPMERPDVESLEDVVPKFVVDHLKLSKKEEKQVDKHEERLLLSNNSSIDNMRFTSKKTNDSITCGSGSGTPKYVRISVTSGNADHVIPVGLGGGTADLMGASENCDVNGVAIPHTVGSNHGIIKNTGPLTNITHRVNNMTSIEKVLNNNEVIADNIAEKITAHIKARMEATNSNAATNQVDDSSAADSSVAIAGANNDEVGMNNNVPVDLTQSTMGIPNMPETGFPSTASDLITSITSMTSSSISTNSIPISKTMQSIDRIVNSIHNSSGGMPNAYQFNNPNLMQEARNGANIAIRAEESDSGPIFMTGMKNQKNSDRNSDQNNAKAPGVPDRYVSGVNVTKHPSSKPQFSTTRELTMEEIQQRAKNAVEKAEREFGARAGPDTFGAPKAGGKRPKSAVKRPGTAKLNEEKSNQGRSIDGSRPLTGVKKLKGLYGTPCKSFVGKVRDSVNTTSTMSNSSSLTRSTRASPTEPIQEEEINLTHANLFLSEAMEENSTENSTGEHQKSTEDNPNKCSMQSAGSPTDSPPDYCGSPEAEGNSMKGSSPTTVTTPPTVTNQFGSRVLVTACSGNPVPPSVSRNLIRPTKPNLPQRPVSASSSVPSGGTSSVGTFGTRPMSACSSATTASSSSSLGFRKHDDDPSLMAHVFIKEKETLNKRIDSLRNENQRLKSRIGGMQSERTALQTSGQSNLRSLQLLKEKVENLEKSLEQERKHKESAERRVRIVENQIQLIEKEYKEEIETLEGDREVHVNERIKLEQRLIELMENITSSADDADGGGVGGSGGGKPGSSGGVARPNVPKFSPSQQTIDVAVAEALAKQKQELEKKMDRMKTTVDCLRQELGRKDARIKQLIELYES